MKSGRLDARARAGVAARDTVLQAAVLKACDHSLSARAVALSRLPDPGAARQAATDARMRAVDRLEDLLRELAERLAKRGIAVHRAATSEEARRVVADIVRARVPARGPSRPTVVKAKTMVGEEAGLTPALEEAGCRVVETDLGEFIVQLRGEPPSHILAPALHLSRARIGRLFAERLGMEETDDPVRMAAFARKHLRGEFLRADLGVIGVNVAVASTGDLITVSNEGNARLCATLPPVLLAFTGIEKVVATPDDAAAVLRVLPRNATGQTATSYTSLLRGPARPGEPWGPREVHLVLLDNGRSRMATDPDLRDILRCIRCGACLNVCPVYRTIGGHAYGTTYPGPMGILWTAGLLGVERVGDLAHASTLCGECTRACPAGIDLAGAILHLRARVPKPWPRRIAFAVARFVLAGARRFVLAGRVIGWVAHRWPGLHRRVARWMGWTNGADVPVPARESFRALWKKRFASPTISPSPVGTEISARGDGLDRAASSSVAPVPSPGGMDDFLARFAEASGEVVWARDVVGALREVVARVAPRAALVSGDAREAGEALRALGVPVLMEDDASRQDAAGMDLGVTVCLALVAETGSILLRHPPGRAASLLPDTHVVLARRDQVIPSLEDALARTRGDEPSFTLVTGPSRTADIEKTLVLGMHGPRRLILCLLDASPSGFVG